MNRANIGVLLFLIILFIFLSALSLYFGTRVFQSNWPLKLRLENSLDKGTTVSVYINGKIFNTFEFSKSALIIIGENVINVNTGRPLSQNDIDSISLQVFSSADITVKSNVEIKMVYTDTTDTTDTSGAKNNVEKITSPGTYNIYY